MVYLEAMQARPSSLSLVILVTVFPVLFAAAQTQSPVVRVDKVEIIIYMGNSKNSGLEGLLKAIPSGLVNPIQPTGTTRVIPAPTSSSKEIPLFNPYDKGHEFIESEIRRAIRKPSGKLTQADLESVRKLNMPFTGSHLVRDITPLAKLKNLEELTLIYQHVSDLQPLAGLNHLRKVIIFENLITDLTPLAGLNNLNHLDIHSNPIQNLGSLRGLSNLQSLHVSNSPSLTKYEIEKLRKFLPACKIR